MSEKMRPAIRGVLLNLGLGKRRWFPLAQPEHKQVLKSKVSFTPITALMARFIPE